MRHAFRQAHQDRRIAELRALETGQLEAALRLPLAVGSTVDFIAVDGGFLPRPGMDRLNRQTGRRLRGICKYIAGRGARGMASGQHESTGRQQQSFFKAHGRVRERVNERSAIQMIGQINYIPAGIEDDYMIISKMQLFRRRRVCVYLPRERIYTVLSSSFYRIKAAFASFEN